MTSRQESKLNMYNAVITYSDASTLITAIIPAYGTTLTTFKAQANAINTTSQLEAQVISGITINKADLKKSVCTTTTAVAAAVYAFAASINDPILQQKAKYTYSDLFKLKDDELTIIVQNIQGVANTVIASLTPYGIIAATLTALQDLIDQYSTTVPAPRNATAQRKAYRIQLAALFLEADKILKSQLDKIALQFKTTQPDFYNTYVNNRIIINAPTSSTQVKGIITDSTTVMPIPNATATVEGLGYTTTSNLQGEYAIKIPIPGLYTFIYTIEGYQTQQIPNIEIILGQATILNVQLITLTQG